ncbi:MAG: hydrogenase maturation nickel metallochaperone HypA [Brockia lithotrophica]|nr:hydrogenase maturation nickel metallochaperone HypA [Brockia lithotrophica]
MSHELALMGDILNLIAEDMKVRGLSKVLKIELIVGELSNAMPDALEMAFDIHKAMKSPILDESSELVIIREEARMKCVFCGHEYTPDNRVALCPNCGMPGGKIISGETLKVLSYEGS